MTGLQRFRSRPGRWRGDWAFASCFDWLVHQLLMRRESNSSFQNATNVTPTLSQHEANMRRKQISGAEWAGLTFFVKSLRNSGRFK